MVSERSPRAVADAPAGPAADPAWGGTDDPVLESWRRRSTTLLLGVIAAVGLPPLLISLASGRVGLPVALKLFYVAEYAAVWVLLLWRRLDNRVRVGLVLLMVYVPGVIGLARMGLAGSGRIYLMALPLLAFILGGSGWGLAGALLSVATAVLFLGLAAAGLLSSTLANPGEAADVGLWLVRTLVMVMLLVPIVLLLERSHRLQREMLEAERQVSARLREEEARSRRAYADLVEQRRQRRELEAAMLEVVERERRLAGHELHDGVCQQLAAARARCQVLQGGAGGDADRHVAAVQAFLDGALDQAHALAQGLSPGELSIEELPVAVEEFARAVAAAQGGHVVVRSHVTDELPAVDPQTTVQLFRIAQEAVRNAVTHGSPGRIDISIRGGDAPRLVIEDDGRGVRRSDGDGNGMGLRIMRYRAESLGGRCEIASGDAGGTRVTVTLPPTGPRETADA